MTEVGVYILGAVALSILAAAGIAMNDPAVIICAVAASGAAYMSQLAAALPATTLTYHANSVFMLASFAAWALGVFLLF